MIGCEKVLFQRILMLVLDFVNLCGKRNANSAEEMHDEEWANLDHLQGKCRLTADAVKLYR